MGKEGGGHPISVFPVTFPIVEIRPQNALTNVLTLLSHYSKIWGHT